MAALLLTIFYDVTNRRFVQGLKSTGVFVLPEIEDQDKIQIQLQLLKLSPNGGVQTPYEVIDPNGYVATVAIVSSDRATTYATIELSTVTGQFLTGLLNCNTVGLVAAVGAATGKRLEAIFAISATDGTSTFGTSRPIFVNYAPIRSGTPTPVENATYLTEAQLRQIFVLKLGEDGDTITLTSPDGTKQIILSCSNDGAFLADTVQ